MVPGGGIMVRIFRFKEVLVKHLTILNLVTKVHILLLLAQHMDNSFL